MPLHTYATCPRCSLEVDLTDLPEPIQAKLATGNPPRCGRCGSLMALSRLWPALLAMPVTAFHARLLGVRSGAA